MAESSFESLGRLNFDLLALDEIPRSGQVERPAALHHHRRGVGHSASVNRGPFRIPCTLPTQRENDDESGLMHYRARSYDPALGRFLQVDPPVRRRAMHHYAYMSNSPIWGRDSSGMGPEWWENLKKRGPLAYIDDAGSAIQDYVTKNAPPVIREVVVGVVEVAKPLVKAAATANPVTGPLVVAGEALRQGNQVYEVTGTALDRGDNLGVALYTGVGTTAAHQLPGVMSAVDLGRGGVDTRVSISHGVDIDLSALEIAERGFDVAGSLSGGFLMANGAFPGKSGIPEGQYKINIGQQSQVRLDTPNGGITRADAPAIRQLVNNILNHTEPVMTGSGGSMSVYWIPAGEVTAGKPYIGKTLQPIAGRMKNADHRMKTPSGNPPAAFPLAEGLTPLEGAGVEGLLIDAFGGPNFYLSNAIRGLDLTLKKNAGRIKAGEGVIEPRIRK